MRRVCAISALWLGGARAASFAVEEVTSQGVELDAAPSVARPGKKLSTATVPESCDFKGIQDFLASMSTATEDASEDYIDQVHFAEHLKLGIQESVEQCIFHEKKCAKFSIRDRMPDIEVAEALEQCQKDKGTLCWGELVFPTVTFSLNKQKSKELKDVHLKPALALCVPTPPCTEEALQSHEKDMVDLFMSVIEGIGEHASDEMIHAPDGGQFVQWKCGGMGTEYKIADVSSLLAGSQENGEKEWWQEWGMTIFGLICAVSFGVAWWMSVDHNQRLERARQQMDDRKSAQSQIELQGRESTNRADSHSGLSSWTLSDRTHDREPPL